MDGLQELMDIQRFYKNSTVFLTGATGFIGKLVLEKVLRALPVKKVFILVRKKKEVPADKRFQDIFESPAFDVIKRNYAGALQKVCIMEGDCSLPMLGLSQKDQDSFINEVDVVFHVAATVRFDNPLNKATVTNVRSTRDLIDLAQKVKKLKTFVYLGTGFSNCNKMEIKEEVYPVKIEAEKLIMACECLDNDSFNNLTETLTKGWPNSYTFSKQISEDYINRKARDIPICIVRPTIVISTMFEPVAAFVDNLFTLASIIIGNALGITRISYYQNTILDIVPVDFVVNQCIAAGWQTGEMFKPFKTEVPVYNVSSVMDNPITQEAVACISDILSLLGCCCCWVLLAISTMWFQHYGAPVHFTAPIGNTSHRSIGRGGSVAWPTDQVWDSCEHYARQIPSEKILLFPLYFRTTCRYNYLFLRIFFHVLVAHIIDISLRLKGKQPRFATAVAKLHKVQESYEYFMTRNFFCHVENTHKLLKKMSFKDRELFNFDVTTINWDNYFAQYVRGLRIYLLKDPIETVPKAKKHYTYIRRIFILALIIGTIILYALGKIFLFRVVPVVFGLMLEGIRTVVC